MKKKTLFLIALYSLCSLQAYGQKMPVFERLDPFWQKFFTKVDKRLGYNFQANNLEYSNAKLLGDPYVTQLEKMGYVFDGDQPKPLKFYDSMNWVLEQIEDLVEEGEVTEADVLRPGKAFEKPNGEVFFVPIGGTIPPDTKKLNLLKPDVFSRMLEGGLFPTGGASLAKTNQTLAEHDLAHLLRFVASPWYMKAVRHGFKKVGEKIRTNPKVGPALENFDSLYSLRLYYMIEVFSLIRNSKKVEVQKYLRFPKESMSLDEVRRFINGLRKEDPIEFARYLNNIYRRVPSWINSLGGESADVMNRVRKFDKGPQTGTIYSKYSQLESKFNGSSIYSMYLNAVAALTFKREDQDDFQDVIDEIHAPFLAALHGMLDLNVDDWVNYAVEEKIDTNSPIHRSICQSGIWNKHHVIYWAYCHDEFDMVLKADKMQ